MIFPQNSNFHHRVNFFFLDPHKKTLGLRFMNSIFNVDYHNHFPYRHNVLIMSHKITGPNRQTLHHEAKQTPISGSEIDFDTICKNSHPIS